MPTTVTRFIDWGFLLLPLLIAPLMFFPRIEWIWIAFCVPILWIVDLVRRGQALDRTPLNASLALLLVMALVSVYATFDVEFSLPKLAGLLLGVFVYFGVVRFVGQSDSRLRIAVLAFCAGGVALVPVCLLGTQWKLKLPLLGEVAGLFPVRLTGLPGAEEGFNANPVGGSAILFLPLLFLLVRRSFRNKLPWLSSRRGLLGVFFTGGFLLVSALLLLSQSRGAWMAFAFSCWIVAVIAVPRLSWVSLLLIVVLLASLPLWNPAHLNFLIYGATGSDPGEIGFTSRMELWSRALYVIQDFPLSGMGMNTFRKVVPVLYPLFNFPDSSDVASAHNHLLQVGVDLGIPGMVAYVALWTSLFRLLLLVWRRSPDPDCRLIAAGLGWGLTAQFLYQMTDAIPLGAKLGIFFWVAMALSVTVFRRSGVAGAGRFREWFHPSDGTAVLLWLLVSLLAIALVEEYPYVGLGVVLVGGILMGCLALEGYLLLPSEKQCSEAPQPE